MKQKAWQYIFAGLGLVYILSFIRIHTLALIPSIKIFDSVLLTLDPSFQPWEPPPFFLSHFPFIVGLGCVGIALCIGLQSRTWLKQILTVAMIILTFVNLSWLLVLALPMILVPLYEPSRAWAYVDFSLLFQIFFFCSQIILFVLYLKTLSKSQP